MKLKKSISMLALATIVSGTLVGCNNAESLSKNGIKSVGDYKLSKTESVKLYDSEAIARALHSESRISEMDINAYTTSLLIELYEDLTESKDKFNLDSIHRKLIVLRDLNAGTSKEEDVSNLMLVIDKLTGINDKFGFEQGYMFRNYVKVWLKDTLVNGNLNFNYSETDKLAHVALNEKEQDFRFYIQEQSRVLSKLNINKEDKLSIHSVKNTLANLEFNLELLEFVNPEYNYLSKAYENYKLKNLKDRVYKVEGLKDEKRKKEETKLINYLNDLNEEYKNLNEAYKHRVK